MSQHKSIEENMKFFLLFQTTPPSQPLPILGNSIFIITRCYVYTKLIIVNLLKLAKAFDVSVDYLLGDGMNATYDKEMVKRLDEVENLPSEESSASFTIWIW